MNQMKTIENFAHQFKQYLAALLCNLGVSANALTMAGLLLAFAAAFLIYRGSFFWAGGALLLSGAFDLLDGAVARLSKKPTAFGGILDSSMDRYGDALVFAGILFFYFGVGDLLAAALAFSALVGSFLISYVRARAECEIENCKVGFWERGERLVYLSLGLLFNNLEVVLWILGIGTHLTAVLRLTYAHRQPLGWHKVILDLKGRRSSWYLLKVLVLFLVVALVRI